MNRKETTKRFTDLLIADRLTGFGKHYATEVTLDMGTSNARRVDIMQFYPKGSIYVSDIEKGEFICYEIKSCLEDIYSGHELNFVGEKNYIVTTAECYKELLWDMTHTADGEKATGGNNKFYQWYCKDKPDNVQKDFGIILAKPQHVRVNYPAINYRACESKSCSLFS